MEGTERVVTQRIQRAEAEHAADMHKAQPTRWLQACNVCGHLADRVIRDRQEYDAE